jgi:Skp family chaperone for outer membrane proteins
MATVNVACERKEATTDVLHAQGSRRPQERVAQDHRDKLMEEEARHRQEEHDQRRAKEEKPLTEKVKEVVGVR